MKPGITLAMIVRDEERKLPRCLDSVKGVVSEIAIVDTGSTDDTLKIAKKRGARTHEIEWPGAFDAARNESLRLVETEWVLWLDADEWLLPESGRAIPELIKREDAYCFSLIRREVGEAEEQMESSLIRLFRSQPYVPFVGVVHEHLDKSALETSGDSRKEYETDLVFLHDGYEGVAGTSKPARYLELLHEELRRRPGQIYYEVKVACTLASLKSPEAPAALERLGDRLLSEQDRDEQDPIVASAFAALFEAIPNEQLKSARADSLARVAKGWFPDSPAALWGAAQFEVRRGNLGEAFRILLDLERLAVSGRFDGRAAYQSAVLGVALWTNLGIVAHQLGRRDVARRNYERLLAADPKNPVARQNLPLL